jgi:hypothetical protein
MSAKQHRPKWVHNLNSHSNDRGCTRGRLHGASLRLALDVVASWAHRVDGLMRLLERKTLALAAGTSTAGSFGCQAKVLKALISAPGDTAVLWR